ncbi:MAG: ABC transporter permease [Bacilli bacterium]
MKNPWMLSLSYSMRSQLKEKSFWITLGVLILFIVGYYGFFMYMSEKEAAHKDKIIVVNETSLPVSMQLKSFEENYEFSYEDKWDERTFKNSIIDEDVQAAFHITESKNGYSISYVDDVEDQMLQMTMVALVDGLVKNQTILQSDLPDDIVEKMSTPPTSAFTSVLSDKEHDQLVQNGIINLAFSFLLYMFTMVYPQMLAMSFISAKNNRATESLFTRITPTQYLFGKIGAMIAVATIQIVILMGAVLTSFQLFKGNDMVEMIQEALSFQAISVFLIAYVTLTIFTAGLHTMFSSFVSRVEDYQNLNFIAMIIPMTGFFISVSMMAPSDFTPLKELLTFLPGAGIYIILSGVLLGKLQGIMLVLSMLAQFVYTFILIRLGATVYRKLMFSYDAKFSWGALFSFLRPSKK